MTIPIAVQEVKLPEGFHVNKRSENGAVVFGFSSPVALPYDYGSLQQYRRASQDRALFGLSLKREDLTALTYAVVQATLPEFVGDNGFYQADFDASGMYGIGMLENGKMGLFHIEDGKSRGGLHLALHSESRFFPVLTEEDVERPTIDKGSVTGKVYLAANIPHPKDGSYIYWSEVGAAIVASLAHEQPLTLQKDPLVRSGYEAGNLRVYVQVDNPTLERMQAALTAERVLAEYFAEHIEPIKEAARIFNEAQGIDSNYRQKVVSEHRQLLGQVERARKKLDEEIPIPASIDDTVARIDIHINAKLREANDRIAHLSAGFPRGLLQYATAETSQR